MHNSRCIDYRAKPDEYLLLTPLQGLDVYRGRTKYTCRLIIYVTKVVPLERSEQLVRYDLTGVPLEVVLFNVVVVVGLVVIVVGLGANFLTVFLKLLRQFSTDFALLCLKMFV